MNRTCTIERNTNETRIALSLNLDGTGQTDLETGIGFFDHMLEQIARHGLIDINLQARGDLEIDDHHTVEDIGIVFGQALAESVGDKRGIKRYGSAYVPLDESLSRVVIDFSGRPHLSFDATFTRALIGNFETELVREFFQGVVNHASITLHIDNIRGINSHHIAETIFKAFGRALRMALESDTRMADMIPSTKGSL